MRHPLRRTAMTVLSLSCGLVVLSACGPAGNSGPTIPGAPQGGGGGGGGGGGNGGRDGGSGGGGDGGGTSEGGSDGAGPIANCPPVRFSLSPPVAYPVGISAWNVAVGDLNGDGKADFVAGNTEDRVPPNDDCSVGAFLGKGDGTFAPMVVSPYGPGGSPPMPGAVALADFNGDGKLDLVGAGGAIGANPQFMPGNGDGTFGAAVEIPVTGVGADSNAGGWVVAADFNGDGKPDLLIGTTLRFGILLNSGNAQFAGDVDYDLTGDSAGIAVADFNGDGKPDVVSVDTQHGSVAVFSNGGAGQFGSPQSYNVTTGPDSGGPFQRVAAADFNGDGAIDLAVSNEGTTITVLANLGNNSFGNPTYSTIKNDFGNTLVATDLNGDGKADLAVSEGTYGTVEVLTNSGNGTFGAATSFAGGNPAGAMVAGNFKGTGPLSLLVVNNNGGDSTPGAVIALIGACQ
jgi:FG-GAP-like repeat/FG-GAP repeat